MIFWKRFCQFILPYDGILIRREALKQIAFSITIVKYTYLATFYHDYLFVELWQILDFQLHLFIQQHPYIITSICLQCFQQENLKLIINTKMIKKNRKKEYFINILVSSLCDFPWIKIWFAQRKENQKLQFQFHIMINNSRYFHLLYRRIRFVMILYSNRNM